MARVNTDILGISELKGTRLDKFNSDDHYIYYCGQESLRRNGVSLIVNKRVWNALLGCNPQKDRMNLVHSQDRPFNTRVTQLFVPTKNAEEAEVEQFYENLQNFLELMPKKKKKKCSFHHRGLECKIGKSGYTWSNRQVWPWSTKWSRAKANNFAKRTHRS